MRSIEELIANIDEIMDGARAVPFSADKCVVDGRELRTVVEEIRMNLPQEIRQSKAVMTDREKIISEARKEADEILSKAQERARAMVSQEAVYKEAKEKADKMVASAEEQANEILRGAFTFSDEMLLDTENAVNQSLETCSLIKLHKPKYNILLKDDKGYHYIKITNEEYPRIVEAKKAEDDGAEYLGPYTGSFAVRQSVDEACKIFRIPTCRRVFPRDIGKGRPCLNYSIGLCLAPCRG